jgi:maleylacetate reductase
VAGAEPVVTRDAPPAAARSIIPQQLTMTGPFVHDAFAGRIVFGAGRSRTALAGEIERLGADRVLVICSPRDAGLAAALCSPFAGRVAGRFEDVRAHVPAELAERARAQARTLAADCLLCIGGGSATGMAKAVALEWTAPIVAVPTTYAGSEMTPVWGITRDRRKTTGRALEALPRVVVYDPELTVSLPPSLTGTSAINAVAHCVEALYAPAANPTSTLLALAAAGALARGAPRAVRDPADLDARSETLYGAHLAGGVLASAGSSVHHRICHVLGGAYDLPHAETHTVVLPHVVAFLAPALGPEMASLEDALGTGGAAGALGTGGAAGALYDLGRAVGAPAGLGEIGLAPAQLDAAAALIADHLPSESPRPLDSDGIAAILRAAFAGERPASG